MGEIIGPYRVLRSLGHGGMGEVFLAERADQQFQQRVAIKLVKRGLSKQVQSRLRIERQILASLEHPNIARLLDGGSTKDGTPYIVMEYVDGKPIDEYSDERRLTINQRLELFRSVCAAVHSAHQNLIVHRDLKPSNILVTAAGVPKLLDFGIAKMLDTRQLSQTVALTEADVRMLTPDHASPEQLSGDLITTASDTYVLGVLLYELLTGCKPFAVKGRSFAELERTICEDPPMPPSQVFSRGSDAKQSSEEIAANRSSTVAKLKRELQGDLGSIILMALRKEPERRYSSVRQFSDDIGRYLQGLPVNARLDTWTYRATKFVKRHAVVVGLGTLLAATLVGFTINTYLTSRELRTERDVAAAQSIRADKERSGAQAISNFLIDLFNKSDPDQARGKELTALEILDLGAQRIRTELPGQRELQAVLMNTVGNVYLRLGKYERAQPLLEESWRIFSQELKIETLALAEVALNLGELHLRGDLSKAEEFMNHSIGISRRVEGPNSRGVARGKCGLGIVHRERNQLDLAERQLRDCITMYDALGNVDASESAIALDHLARTLARRGNFTAAEEIYRRWLALNHNLEPDNTRLIEHRHSLATVLQGKGALQDAEQLYREVAASIRTVWGEESEQLVVVLTNHGSVLQELSEFERADRSFKEALSINEKLKLPDDARAYLMGRMASLALDRGDTITAERLYRDALELLAKLDANSRFRSSVLTGLSKTLVQRDQPKDAQHYIEQALPLFENVPGKNSYLYGLAEAILGRALSQQGMRGQAEPLIRGGYHKYVAQRGSRLPEARLLRSWLDDLEPVAVHPTVSR